MYHGITAWPTVFNNARYQLHQLTTTDHKHIHVFGNNFTDLNQSTVLRISINVFISIIIECIVQKGHHVELWYQKVLK